LDKQKLVGSLPKFGAKEVMSEVCEACQLGKQVRHPFAAQTIHVSSKPLEIIHSDVWTTKIQSIGGCKYYVSFIDDHTRKVWVYFMKHKGEVFQHFLNFKIMVEKEKGVSIKCLRSDSNLTFPICCNFLLQKQQLERIKIANLNVPNINNNKYCSLYLKA